MLISWTLYCTQILHTTKWTLEIPELYQENKKWYPRSKANQMFDNNFKQTLVVSKQCVRLDNKVQSDAKFAVAKLCINLLITCYSKSAADIFQKPLSCWVFLCLHTTNWYGTQLVYVDGSCLLLERLSFLLICKKHLSLFNEIIIIIIILAMLDLCHTIPCTYFWKR